MTLTFRDTKGSPLTHPEMDANFRDLDTRIGDYISVREFGFDGVGTAGPDTIAWNAMIAAIQAGDVKRIYIPAGFIIKLDNPNTLVTASNWSLFSDGKYAALIYVVSGPSTILTFGDGTVRPENINIHGFTVDYIGAAPAGSWQFHVNDSARVRIDDIYSRNGSMLHLGTALLQPNSFEMSRIVAVTDKSIAQPAVLIERCAAGMFDNVRLGATADAANIAYRMLKIAPPSGSNVDTITFRDLVCNEATEDHKVALEIDYSHADVGTITFARCAFEQSMTAAVHIHNNNTLGVGGFADRIKFIDGTRLTPHSTELDARALLVEKIGVATCSVDVSDCTIGKGRGAAVLVNGPLTDDQSLQVVIDGNRIYDRRQGLGNNKPGIDVNASGMIITNNTFIANRGNGLYDDYITDSTFTEGVRVLGDVARLTVVGNDFRACTSAEVIDVSLVTGLASGGKYNIQGNIGNTEVVIYPELPATHRAALGVPAIAHTHLRSELISGFDLVNAVENGGFEKGDVAWTKTAGWAINNDSANARSGNYVAVQSNTAGVTQALDNNAYSACVPDDVIYAEAWLKTSAAPTYTTCRVRIEWLDKDFVSLSFTNATNMAGEQLAYVVNTVTGTAPALAAYYRVEVQINKTVGTIYCDTVFAYKKRRITQVLTDFELGTITTSQPLTLTQTWNNAAIVFSAMKINITDTASAATSLLLDLQVGGVSKFSVDNSGNIVSPTTAYYGDVAGTQWRINSLGMRFGTGQTVSWSNGNVQVPDLSLARDAANVLAQRNLTNAQTFRVYNTYTDASNYERVGFTWASNFFTIGVESLGTGITSRILRIEHGASGSIVMGVANNPVLQLYATAAAGFQTNKQIRLTGTVGFGWAPTTPDGSLDTAFHRNAAGVVEINNGTPGSYRDLLARAATLTGGTITTSAPAINITQTWNDAAVVFTGMQMNFTTTAKAANSLLFDIQEGGVSQFGVYAGGNVSSIASNFFFGTSVSNTTGRMKVSPTVGYIMASTYAVAWNSGTTIGTSNTSLDLYLYRDAAATLAQRNGVNAQTQRIYRTYTDASNYQRMAFGWNTTTALMMNEGLGTGADGSVAFNDAALATSATKGFIMIPSCAGIPTGVPADIPTGQIPLVFDSTNNKLYAYDGGWISTAALT